MDTQGVNQSLGPIFPWGIREIANSLAGDWKPKMFEF